MMSPATRVRDWIPALSLGAYAALYFGHSLWAYRRIDADYLGRATPAAWAWAVPLVEIIFPLQLLVALLAPQRIVWRGHVMQVERGGEFHFVRRRDNG